MSCAFISFHSLGVSSPYCGGHVEKPPPPQKSSPLSDLLLISLLQMLLGQLAHCPCSLTFQKDRARACNGAVFHCVQARLQQLLNINSRRANGGGSRRSAHHRRCVCRRTSSKNSNFLREKSSESAVNTTQSVSLSARRPSVSQLQV